MGLILVRYGEIAIKGKNRVEFVRRLRHNMRDALKRRGLSGRVWSEGQRVYVETDQVEEALEALRHVFGIVSLSPVVEVPPDLEAMKAEAVRQALAAGLNPERSYHIATRRADKGFPLTSPEINQVLGAAVQQATGARVDLSDEADVVIGVEVQRERTLVFGQVVPAWGGMPVLSQGRVVALMSGGIDSPVAAWLMMKRGCGVIPIHFYRTRRKRPRFWTYVRACRSSARGSKSARSSWTTGRSWGISPSACGPFARSVGRASFASGPCCGRPRR